MLALFSPIGSMPTGEMFTMEMGMIFIFVPVLLFFAGIFYLLMRDRCRGKSQAAQASLLFQDGGEEGKRKDSGKGRA